jgi:hypothetical protein
VLNFGSNLDSFISANVVTHMYTQFRHAPVFRCVTVGVVVEYLYQEAVVAQLEFYLDIWLEEKLRATTISFITNVRPSDLDLDPGHREYKSGVVGTRLVRCFL